MQLNQIYTSVKQKLLRLVHFAWHKGLRIAFVLPWRTHAALQSRTAGMLPLLYKVLCHMA